jgi:ADP-ribose pyrophosphatase YjhB (NUDIX family)
MLEKITELQAIAQSALAYCTNEFDIARYKRILEISAELLASNSTHQYEDIFELFTKETGYATPKIDVRGAVFKENKILLVQEKMDQCWTMPGGFADVNLSPAENVIKELKEESGFDCRIIKLIGILDKRKNIPENKKWPHLYKIFFLCEIISPEQSIFDQKEILNVDFFDLNNIPALSEGRTNHKQIDLCFKHYQDLSLPAIFE